MKRQLFSAAITFIASFATTVGVMLGNGTITAENFSTATVLALVLTAGRAALKLATERYLGLQF